MINDRKIERFQEIVREAVEQCGGNRAVSISFVDTEMPSPENGNSYFLHTQAIDSISMTDIENSRHHINIFVGPEGGWSDKELRTFEEQGIQSIHL